MNDHEIDDASLARAPAEESFATIASFRAEMQGAPCLVVIASEHATS